MCDNSYLLTEKLRKYDTSYLEWHLLGLPMKELRALAIELERMELLIRRDMM